jgi:hypothetical protein
VELSLFGVLATESWRDKDLGRARMQESRNPETRNVITEKSVKKGARAQIFSRPMPKEKETYGFVQGVPTRAQRAILA